MNRRQARIQAYEITVRALRHTGTMPRDEKVERALEELAANLEQRAARMRRMDTQQEQRGNG